MNAVLAAGGILYIFGQADLPGKVIVVVLCLGSAFTWSVMLTKLRVIQFARKQNARFLHVFRQDRQPLRLFEKNARFPGSPIFNVYRAGAQEIAFQLLGSAEVLFDCGWRGRFEQPCRQAQKLSGSTKGV